MIDDHYRGRGCPSRDRRSSGRYLIFAFDWPNTIKSTTFTHGQIAEETGHAATQPDARARLAPPQRPRRRVLLVQQDRGRATHHQKGRAPSFFFFTHSCLSVSADLARRCFHFHF